MKTGLSAFTLLLGNGDILGASGVAKSVIRTPVEVFKSQKWKYPFMASFFISSTLCMKVAPKQLLRATVPVVSSIGYIVSGFLVGCGTTVSRNIDFEN